MPADKEGAKGQESLADEQGGSNPSDEGKIPQKKSPEQLAKEYKAEAERKAQEIEELRELNKVLVEEKKERLAELKDKSRLSAAEREEVDTLEQQIASIKADKRSTAWLKINRDESEKIAQETLARYDFQRATRLAEKLAKKEDMGIKDFEKAIVKHMRLVDPDGELSAVDRLEEAYESLKDEKARNEKLEKLEAEKSSGRFTETQPRNPKPVSRKELLESAIGERRSDEGLTALLKQVAEVHQERTTR